ncbi:class I SAM-dependent DNA methyltransferase [Streptomyces sp. GMY02]|uniref:type I restriction-modification system subunit M n=1 Tax=Streptomyces sp. GMY02 TaxID=1333528 RepID=UPI0020B6D8D4|nr:class I SAM-dependent DNA methyltransferase [Streptomyces sp. GMY02]
MEPLDGPPDDQAELPDAADAVTVQDFLWQAVDKLRGSVDAAFHKEFVLGLVFLKYVSESFEERRRELVGELAADGVAGDLVDARLERPEEYTRAGVLWVPQTARWSRIAAHTDGRTSGRILDEAMDALMRENASLRGALPKNFERSAVQQVRLDELVSLIDGINPRDASGTAQDVGGALYEYALAGFADLEARRGGEFYTPQSVVRLIVEILRPHEGRLYDPACGSGGMFVEAAKFVRAHGGRGHESGITVYGQEVNARTWRLAKMNLAVHGIHGDLAGSSSDSLVDDQHPDLKADFVMSVPPFNVKWGLSNTDPRWRYGVSRGTNANYAWLQNAIAKLDQRGTAAIVLANGSMHSTVKADAGIRRAILEADLVACVVALPDRLFLSTGIPASLWILTKDKPTARHGQILFMDARQLGSFASRTRRVLTDADLARIARTYHSWRGTASAGEHGVTYADEPGFCVSESLDSVCQHGFILTPGLYTDASPAPAIVKPGTADPDDLVKLASDLYALFDWGPSVRTATTRPPQTQPKRRQEEDLPRRQDPDVSVGTLIGDERELLRLIAQSPEPVAASTFFDAINPPDFERSAAEEDPRRVAWQEKQFGLYQAVLDLHDGGLIRIVHPANGARPDLMEATEAGYDALA